MTSALLRQPHRTVRPMTAIVWDQVGERADARSASQGGPFASVIREDNQWIVVWWVGPKGTTAVPSREKGRLWVERFARRRIDALGRRAATPGTGPGGAASGYVASTREEQARYDTFIASYVPAKRSRRRCRGTCALEPRNASGPASDALVERRGSSVTRGLGTLTGARTRLSPARRPP